MRRLTKIVLAVVLTGSLVGTGVQTAAAAPTGSASPVRTALAAQKPGNWDQLKYSWGTPGSGNDYSGAIVGNGRIGARVAGGVAADTLQLNDAAFWSGEPTDDSNTNRRTALTQTRNLLAQADTATTVAQRETLLKQAETAAQGMWGRASNGSRFLPVGKLLLDVAGTAGFTGYSRVLDLDRATVTTSYTVGTTKYTREVFANHPDNVIVMRISNDKSQPMSVTAKLAAPAEMTGHSAVSSTGSEITMTGTAPYKPGTASVWAAGRGITFDARLRVKTVGGTVTPTGGNLAIAGATEIVLIYSSATSYKDPFTLPNPAQTGINPSPVVQATMNAAASKTYAQLIDRHMTDHRSLFRRLWLEVNGNTGVGADNAKIYQYSRYEMIASSRAGASDRFHNQQGLWNPEWTPPNESSHFLNENVEKYYALIETGNLSEAGDPLWKFMKNLATNGRLTADKDWGFDGWTAPHFTDIWAPTALANENNEWAVWPMGGVWLSSVIYDHYLFTQDEQFLANDAYPLLKGAAEFALDLLVTDKNGKLVTSPSTSPEHRYRLSDGTTLAVGRGATGDMVLIRQLFHDVLEAADILGADSAADQDLVNRITAANAALLPFAIGAQGEIKEFGNDYAPADPSHRHASHLLGASLRDVISRQTDPQIYAAHKKSLELRGSGGYHPDKSFMWARLGEGDKAMAAQSLSVTSQWGPLGASVPELLVQSQNGEIELLPALPTGWNAGKIEGVRVRGGHELSMTWSGRSVTSATLSAGKSGSVTMRGALFASNVRVVDASGATVPSTSHGDGSITFSAVAGTDYSFQITGSVSITAPASFVGGTPADVTVSVSSSAGVIPAGEVQLSAPQGWVVLPSSRPVGATSAGTPTTATFRVRAPLGFAGQGVLQAAKTGGGGTISAQRTVTVTDPSIVPCTSMSVTAFSSQETASENRPASNVVDCAADPGWTSAWSANSTPPPHWVVVDLGASRNLVSAGCTARSGPNGRIKDVRIETSLNGTTWTQSVEGTFANSTDPQWLTLNGSAARYVRMTGLSSHAGPWISCGEFGAKVQVVAQPVAVELVVQHSDKCLSVAGSSTADGALLTQATCTHGANQKFRLTDAGNGVFSLVGQQSNRCLDVSGASTANGASVVQWGCSTATNQRFALVDDGDGYRLVAQHSQKCLDVNGGGSADGAAIVQYACTSSANQRWDLVAG
ncbi:glycosyl hydrolase family 95 catalytic domain-containing protein [Microbacterium sp. PMB16]|uniref:glycosyl hydrolase family 95 catalytic domain-containing protein n=1 Tax=Microbacterium sp. PMB16 TaxID=3120157 RepID=UPI003F4BB2EB